MVEIKKIESVRSPLIEDIDLGEFTPRTPEIKKAYEWGKKIHAGQKRFSGEPYFDTHCVWIANFLDKLLKNEAWTIAALLHDSIEDKGGSIELIKENFPGELGESVAYIVDGVTKLSTPKNGHSRDFETLRKIAMFRDPGVFLVKLADKTHNVMTLEYMAEPRRQQKAEEAIRAYGRLAGILNCHKWRCWLEDMAFPFAYPEIFKNVKNLIDSDVRMQPDFINSYMDQLGAIMEKSGIDGRIEIIANGYWQAWQKLKRMARSRKTSLSSFSAVNDLVSFRMIVNSDDSKACYELLAGVNRFFGPYLDQDRFDDYIACPQHNYRAIQVTSWKEDVGAVEVAISTQEMENENQWGVVYALNQGKNIDVYRTIEILTPSGGVRFVPEGSTVLDAVAAIQRDLLLDRMASVHVNDRLVKLSDKINPGDVVEVITYGKPMRPNPEWLNYSNRNTARYLRGLLHLDGLRNSAAEGRKTMKNILRDLGLYKLENISTLMPDKIKTLLSELSCVNLEDMYAAIGGGAIMVDEVRKNLINLGITKKDLGWTTFILEADEENNKPGSLTYITGIISNSGGNIIRLVNETLPNGGYSVVLMAEGLNTRKEEEIKTRFEASGLGLTRLEIF